jgi:hypothetical protein
MLDLRIETQERITLCEVLDRVLNKGVVVHGDIILSVAEVDLLYVSLRLLVASVETAMRAHIGSVQGGTLEHT